MPFSFNTLTTRGAFAIVCLALGACSTTVAVVPDAASLPASEVAVLKMKDSRSGVFAVVFDWRGKEVFRGNYWTDATSHLTLPPGRYEVVLRVAGGYQQLSAYPRVRAEVYPGKTYYFASSTILDGRAVKAEYAEAPAVEVPQ